MDLISRAAAAENGAKRFFTGQPCAHGHVCERRVSDFACIQCSRDKRNAWGKGNRDKTAAYLRDWHAKNPEKSKAIQQRTGVKQRPKRSAREKIWHKANSDRMLAYREKWKKKNPDYLNADAAKRRSAKLLRSVPWADERDIRWYYKQAKRLEKHFGVRFHVDHILPLQGRLVSGFHHQDNLQILTEEENLKKSNRFDPSEYQGALP
jgi:hypothetical protein